MNNSLQNENISEDQKPKIVYSKWNKLIIISAENKNKKYFNLLKYMLALLMAIFILISLWFTSQWQTSNVLNVLGIDISQWLSYIPANDTSGNANTINNITKFFLWDLNGAILTKEGVQALIAMGLLSLVMLVPVLIFKNGTIWSISSIVLSSVLLLIIIVLFSLGLASQSKAIAAGPLSVPANMVGIESIINRISILQGQIINPPTGGTLTPEQVAINSKLEITINELISQRDKIVLNANFMSILKNYLANFAK